MKYAFRDGDARRRYRRIIGLECCYWPLCPINEQFKVLLLQARHKLSRSVHDGRMYHGQIDIQPYDWLPLVRRQACHRAGQRRR
jgi:hypothetical protein